MLLEVLWNVPRGVVLEPLPEDLDDFTMISWFSIALRSSTFVPVIEVGKAVDALELVVAKWTPLHGHGLEGRKVWRVLKRLQR